VHPIVELDTKTASIVPPISFTANSTTVTLYAASFQSRINQLKQIQISFARAVVKARNCFQLFYIILKINERIYNTSSCYSRIQLSHNVGVNLGGIPGNGRGLSWGARNGVWDLKLQQWILQAWTKTEHNFVI